ncbi:hypothetical protein [Shewanella livingstonensis]|nr:hypothetical protein [Shewanella livingstonensis]
MAVLYNGFFDRNDPVSETSYSASTHTPLINQVRILIQRFFAMEV